MSRMFITLFYAHPCVIVSSVILRVTAVDEYQQNRNQLKKIWHHS